MAGGAAPAEGGAAQKKKSIVPMILLGCGGILVLGLLGALFTGYFVAKKVASVVDTDLMEKNPAAAVTKLLATLNPDVDVVSVDEDKGVVIVREKKTGKTITLDFEKLKEGQMSIEDDQGAKLELGGGSSAPKLPSWLPAYPNVKQTMMNVTANEGGSTTFSTDDSIEDAAAFYESALTKAGIAVNKASAEAPGQGKVMTVSGEKEGRKANVMVTKSDGVTTVTLSYADK
jgi:hypothetical protein